MNDDDRRVEEERNHYERMGDEEYSDVPLDDEMKRHIEDTLTLLDIQGDKRELAWIMLKAVYDTGKLHGTRDVSEMIQKQLGIAKTKKPVVDDSETLQTRSVQCANCKKRFTNEVEVLYLQMSPLCLRCDKIASDN